MWRVLTPPVEGDWLAYGSPCKKARAPGAAAGLEPPAKLHTAALCVRKLLSLWWLRGSSVLACHRLSRGGAPRSTGDCCGGGCLDHKLWCTSQYWAERRLFFMWKVLWIVHSLLPRRQSSPQLPDHAAFCSSRTLREFTCAHATAVGLTVHGAESSGGGMGRRAPKACARRRLHRHAVLPARCWSWASLCLGSDRGL